MRAIWKGAISFGLVTIPVALYSAVEPKRPKFKLLRGEDHSPVRYKRVAESDQKEVSWDEIVRGYEVEKGRYVVFTEEELEAAAAHGAKKVVEVVQFTTADEIDPIYYKGAYYLVPEPTGLKAYKILQKALEETNKVGLARVAIRDKVHLAAIRPKDNVIVLETMYWPDEIREPAFDILHEEVEVRPEEIQMAELIIENLTAPFKPEEWVDESRKAIEELARKKIEGQEIVAPEAPEPTQVVDLLEALKASVEATKAKTKAKAG